MRGERPPGAPVEVQRLDKWLWFARMVKTRTAAAELVAAGHVRINGTRVTLAAQPVRQGDVLTIALDARIRVVRVAGFCLRRSNAAAARGSYEDIDI